MRLQLHKVQQQIDWLIESALKEDLGEMGDITSQALGPTLPPKKARILVKEEGVLAGLEVAQRVFQRVDPTLTFDACARDGQKIGPGQVVARLYGAASSILTAERTALNFLGRLSGIATLTAQFVEAIRGTKARILDTRKTTPGWRALEKYAVRMGGGFNHRMGLYDMMLIKENHIAAAGGLRQAIQLCLDFRRKLKHPVALEVEVRNLEELKEALQFPVDRIMLDNFPLSAIEEAVKLAGGRVPLEVSGGVTLANVRVLAETGVNYISIGALTHSARSLDFSLRMDFG